ncbi:MAG: hypothetical protein O2856_01230, partial [Planctomycetota bacterium]|nr:hypothetical protein [Planctomycetota bacterium]
MSSISEVVEPRMLLSAASVAHPASLWRVDAVGTKELLIVAERFGEGGSANPKIDEIRLVSNEVQVFATNYPLRHWPGAYYPLYDVAVDTTNLSIPSYLGLKKSDPVAVTVPDRELRVVYFFANIDQPQSELYNLRTFGTSTQLYRRADADGDTGWMTSDVAPGAGSTAGLDFTPAPAAPKGLVSTSASATSNEVTLWFDESPGSVIAGQRFVRQYNISIQSSKLDFFIPLSTNLVVFDSQRFPMTAANGIEKTFGGSKTLTLPADVYSWSVQFRDLPVFPDGVKGNNALATPWSEFSETARFSVLPQGQQILLGRTFADSSTGITTIEWGSVTGATSYEVWINRVRDGKMVHHKTGLSGSSCQTDALDPDDYRVWVRATCTNGTRTSWSKFEEFTVNAPNINVADSWIPIHDATPTITWTAVPRSTQYKISLIDRAKEQQAQTMDFATRQDYEKFITAYSRTVKGSGASHTVATPLAAGNYRIEITLTYSNGKTSQGYRYLNLEPAGVPIPVPGADSYFNWTAEDGAVSYDVWVAFLGQPDPTNPSLPPKWKFDTRDGVMSGSYQLPMEAPAGNYRIWLRPNMASGGQSIKAPWSAPVDFTSQEPLYRSVNVTLQGEKLTWEPVRGGIGYRITIDYKNGIAGNGSTRIFNITGTEFQIPDEFIDGTYSVRVQSLDAGGEPHFSPTAISIQHGKSPWTWNITKTADRIEWNPVPDAVSYEIQILRFYNVVVTQTAGITEPHFSLSSLESGHLKFLVRALRSVDGREFLTQWTSHVFDHGISAPENVRLDGHILKWDGQENA